MKTIKSNYKFWKYLVFGLLTVGIYPIFVRTKIGNGINMITKASAKKTMNFCLVYFLLSPITLTIALYVWFHRLSDKMAKELARRNIAYDFSAKDFWLWNVLGSFILVGPAIYLKKLFKAYYLLAEQYNAEIVSGDRNDRKVA